VARIIWSPEASRRLIEISAYLSLTVPERAASIVERLIASVDRLGHFPRMGRSVAGTGETGARELIVDPFRVIYTTDGDLVEVGTILHSAMDVATRLRELLGDVGEEP
jgi:plasmid stabilization system protein ParE